MRKTTNMLYVLSDNVTENLDTCSSQQQKSNQVEAPQWRGQGESGTPVDCAVKSNGMQADSECDGVSAKCP